MTDNNESKLDKDELDWFVLYREHHFYNRANPHKKVHGKKTKYGLYHRPGSMVNVEQLNEFDNLKDTSTHPSGRDPSKIVKI